MRCLNTVDIIGTVEAVAAWIFEFVLLRLYSAVTVCHSMHVKCPITHT